MSWSWHLLRGVRIASQSSTSSSCCTLWSRCWMRESLRVRRRFMTSRQRYLLVLVLYLASFAFFVAAQLVFFLASQPLCNVGAPSHHPFRSLLTVIPRPRTEKSTQRFSPLFSRLYQWHWFTWRGWASRKMTGDKMSMACIKRDSVI